MTISSTSRKAGPFDGNDATTSFPFTFKVFAAADLRVVHTTPSGVESDLVLDSDYSVSLNGDQDANPGGTLTYPISGSPLATGYRLTIVGDIDYLQPTDITNGGGFYPQVIENALDRGVMLIQQVAEEVDRTIRVAVSDDVTAGLELPASASRADKVLGFDANGDFKVYDTNVSVRATGLEVFTATGGQTVFTTPFTYVPSANALLVFQNGAVLTPGVDFTETSGTSFTLTVGATVGDTVVALAGLDVTGGVQGDQIVDGTVTADKLASTLNLSGKSVTLAPGEISASELASTLDFTSKTVTVATAASSSSDTSAASTAMVQAAISARTASDSQAGISELGTAAEYLTGIDPNRVLTLKTARDNNLVLSTAQATTSGASIDFTSIPAWCKRITGQLSGVSNAAGNLILLQLGDSGGIETTGYECASTSGTANNSSTSAFIVAANMAAGALASGHFTLTRIDGNEWIFSAVVHGYNGLNGSISSGRKTLSATLDRIRLLNASSDTFDAGKVNIIYE